MTTPWTPTFYWTGDAEQDAILINRPHIDAEGPLEDRMPMTLHILRTLQDQYFFTLTDALNIQNMLLAHNNYKGIVPGFRKHPVNFADSAAWQNVPMMVRVYFPVYAASAPTLLQWYKQVLTIHPLSDLNGRTFGIIVSILYNNRPKS